MGIGRSELLAGVVVKISTALTNGNELALSVELTGDLGVDSRRLQALAVSWHAGAMSAMSEIGFGTAVALPLHE